MKNSIQTLFLFSAISIIVLVSTGCPVGIPHPLGKPGTEKIDLRLIGTWTAQTDSVEVLKMEVSKSDDYTYHIEVLEQGEMFAVESNDFKGWVTKLDGKNFFCAIETDPAEEQYYHYHYSFEGATLVLYDISLLVGGMDAVTSTEAYREELSASLKLPDCLTGGWKYSKQ